MTIKYSYGNVFDTTASVTACATTVLNAMKALILTHSNWSLVEDVSPGSSSTYRWVVFKCAAAGSGLPSDFYIIIIVNTSTGTFTYLTAETYVSGASRTITGYAAADTGATTRTPNADTTNPGNVTALGTTGAPTFTNGPTPQFGFGLNHSTSVQWFAVVYDDHIVLNNAVGNASAMYLGAITSLVTNPSVNDPMPLVTQSLASATAAPGGYSTRHPFASGAGQNYWYLGNISSANPSWASMYAFNNSESQGDLFQGGAVPVSEFFAWHVNAGSTVGSAPTRGGVRGKYKSMRGIPTAPSGMAIGDTVTLNGTTWVVVNVTNSLIIVDAG